MDPSSSNQKPSSRAGQVQQVFIGIFPASHIFVRDEVSDAEGHLTELFNALNSPADGRTSEELFANWNKSMREMDPVREEDEDNDTATRKSFKLTPPPDQALSTRARLPVYPASIRSVSPTESQFNKPLPPRPTLTSGDDTLSGSAQPIIDEIASALREWHALMFQYLAQRDYRLFHAVREYIEVLHLGRRQLLSQTLSSEETVNLRRECVARLVSGNLMQNLDVIVRHPTWGGLVNVDVEGDIDQRSWMSAIRMYALQAALAQMDVSPTPNTPYKMPHMNGSIDYSVSAPTPIPLSASLHSAFPELPRPRGHSRLIGSLSPSSPSQAKAKFYHVFLDLRAFVASPCAPGETAELFFSLYNKADARFVSEEFCAVLNHNGVLARDPSARIRTLFTDLVQSDAQDPIYLVCKIVRNGSMKMASNMGSISENPRQTLIGSNAYANGSMSSDSFSRNSTSTEPPQQYRRPFGCAVLELTQLSAMAAEQVEVSSTREHTMPIFVAVNETTFSMLHQDILNHNVREYEKSPRSVSITCSDDLQLIVP